MSHRHWRVFGALAIANIVLLFGSMAVEGMTPELGSPKDDIVNHLMRGAMPHRFAGGYVEALSTLVFLLAALLLARLLRGTDEWTGWLASGINATAVIYVASGLIVGFPAGAAAIYDGHHGASVQTVTIVNDIRNFAFFLSVADLGVFTACVGIAILMTRTMPRWVGWAGTGAGVLCVLSVAAARGGAHNIANLVQMVWWVALAVLALRKPATQPAAPAPRDAVAV
jgi:hypothetical protein